MKVALISLILLSLTACGTHYNIPYGKTQRDFYNDLVECEAVQQRINPNGNITKPCMFGKGYTAR
jgi:CHASE1-domain containing sensor protein